MKREQRIRNKETNKKDVKERTNKDEKGIEENLRIRKWKQGRNKGNGEKWTKGERRDK